MPIQYNAPVVLTFSLIALAVHVLDIPLQGAITYSIFVIRPTFSLVDPWDYVRLVSHIIGHANLNHLIGNLSMLLLLGPILEERYGSATTLKMVLITALVVGAINVTFLPTGLLGASPIVFMFIALISIVGLKDRAIPLSFVVVAFLFMGKELLDSFQQDNISQMAHLVGGLMGALFGFTLARIPANPHLQDHNRLRLIILEAAPDTLLTRPAYAPFLGESHPFVRLTHYLFARFWILAGVAMSCVLLIGMARAMTAIPQPVHSPPLPPQSICNAFVVGGKARIVWPAVNVRRTPGYLDNSEVCGYAKMGDRFVVVDSPAFVDGICWWPIKHDTCNGKGWIAEN